MVRRQHAKRGQQSVSLSVALATLDLEGERKLLAEVVRHAVVDLDSPDEAYKRSALRFWQSRRHRWFADALGIDLEALHARLAPKLEAAQADLLKRAAKRCAKELRREPWVYVVKPVDGRIRVFVGRDSLKLAKSILPDEWEGYPLEVKT